MFSRKSKNRGSQQNDSNRESITSPGNSIIGSSETILDSKTALGVLSGMMEYEVYYLGVVRDINMGTSRKRDKEALLVDQVEEAQLQGKIHISPREEDKVKIFISRHGMRVLDITKKEVLQRHPLHIIAQVIQYEDGHSKPNVAFKIQIGQPQVSKGVYQCYVFQCLNEEQAQSICQSVQRIFDAITVK